MAKKSNDEAKQMKLEKELSNLGKEKIKLLARIKKAREKLNDHLRQQHIKDRYGNEMASLVSKMGVEDAKELLKSTQSKLKEQKLQPRPVSTNSKAQDVGIK